ncbi:Sugar-specific transcriptional regulator TrmB [uncultured archaeon]|nr:Sugar-specific transcriptional regulator TrmB [uncultured archaeon]
MNAELLENLGLTKAEIKVYLCLLELNSASASEIAERCGIYRKNAYDALGRLIKKGLVGFAKVETKTIFIATEPQKLLDFLEVRKSEIRSILPELKKIYRAKPAFDDVAVFKGKNGLKSIFEELLKSRANYDLFGSAEKFKEILPYYYPIYQRKKAENKVQCRGIYSENERGKEYVKEFIGEARFLHKEFVNQLSTTMVYDPNVAIIIWKENPIGIVIKSPEVAESYKRYFEMLWANAKT